MTVSGKEIDLSKGVIPILVALTLLAFVASASFAVGSVFAGFQRDSDQFRVELTGIKTDLASIKQQVQQLVGQYPMADRWSRTDQARWCWAAERLNASWKCPAEITER